MKILYIGSVEASKKILESLIVLKVDIVGVLTRKTSSLQADFADLSVVCKKNGIFCNYIDSINSREAREIIRAKDPDVLFCFGWSEILGREVLDLAPMGVIGYHPALLPRNRGRHPIVWALVLGLNETGSTFFLMDEGVDSGDILSQRKITINYSDDAKSLYEKIIGTAIKQIKKLIPRLENGSYESVKQDIAKANTWRKRSERDGEIDWRMSSYSIYNLVRALTRPYVGAHLLYKNKPIKVWYAEEVKTGRYDNIEPGKVIEVSPGAGLLIKTGTFCIKIPRDKFNKEIKKGEYV